MPLSQLIREARQLLNVKIGDTRQVKSIKDVGIEAWNTGGKGKYVCVGFEERPGFRRMPIWRHETSPWAQQVLDQRPS